MSSKIDYISLKWDTDYFKIPSAKIIINDTLTSEDLNNIVNYCNDYDFITLLNKDNNEINNQFIAKTGAYLADINIEFVKFITAPVKTNQNINIINDYPYNKYIENLALVTFEYSRFYNIPELGDKGRSIYGEWVKNAFNKKDKFFCINKDNESCNGFLLFHIDGENIVIELIAVDKNFSGKGIGKALIYSLENFAYENKINRIFVGTQSNNIIAQNFYISCGFKHNKVNSIYIIKK